MVLLSKFSLLEQLEDTRAEGCLIVEVRNIKLSNMDFWTEIFQKRLRLMWAILWEKMRFMSISVGWWNLAHRCWMTREWSQNFAWDTKCLVFSNFYQCLLITRLHYIDIRLLYRLFALRAWATCNIQLQTMFNMPFNKLALPELFKLFKHLETHHFVIFPHKVIKKWDWSWFNSSVEEMARHDIGHFWSLQLFFLLLCLLTSCWSCCYCVVFHHLLLYIGHVSYHFYSVVFLITAQ